MIIRNEEGRAIRIENLSDLTEEISDIEKVLNKALKNKKKNIPMPQDEKDALNYNFYRKYYRFIQEGTWVKEDYVDDEKYYVDA